ncbi:putative 39S ribosomal protein L45 mitochondrial [Taenia solium]|eukprot:TsM_000717800 transcript=TsM_000717800 gene=TsM_000717800
MNSETPAKAIILGFSYFDRARALEMPCRDSPSHMALLSMLQILLTSVRFIRHKPWVPKFRLIRQMQPWVQPFDPDLISIGGKSGTERATSSEIREHLRRNGLMPPLLFQEHRINLTHSGRIFDEYVPPEGDGKSSLLSTGTITDVRDSVVKKAKTTRAALRIRKHKPTFSTSSFPLEADAIYKEVHTLLPKFYDNQERILELTTEKAFVEMTEGLKLRTLHWEFVGGLEPPRVVSCRTEEAMGRDNMFGQVTVRFHTQQILAIYDRFGRLLYGHPSSPVDVLEYVVFENYITDEYGRWRIHGKVAPAWARGFTAVAAPQKTRRLTSSPDPTTQ